MMLTHGNERPDLTIAICAYNSEKRIGMVLESLAGQQVPAGLTWELLVIDNASKDGTSKITAAMGAKLCLPLRLIYEATPGLANARRRAALDAKSELLSFLDDDTVVDEDWIAQCVKFLGEHPEAGIVGAKVEPLFEDPARRPADFQERFAGLLSMFDQGDVARRLKFPQDPNPVGAGMSGRTELFRLIFDEFRTMNVGRAPDCLSGGEDLEAMFIADRMGWEVWYAPSLRLLHFVPNHRLSEQYRDQWIVDTASCNVLLEVLNGRRSRGTRLGWLWRWLGVLSRVARYGCLGLLPGGPHSKAAKWRFYRRYYSSKARGCRDLVFHPGSVDRIFELIETHRRTGAAERSESACI
jgi:hypothetical protein